MGRALPILIGALTLWAGSPLPLVAQMVLQDTTQSESPPAQIEQAAWLAGTLQGISNEGDEVLESWLGPKGGMMAGVVLNTEKSEESTSESQWSEHMVIVSEGQTLALHYNVFDAISGGGSFIKHRLLRIEGDGCKLFFQSITFECKRDQEGGEVVGMTIYW